MRLYDLVRKHMPHGGDLQKLQCSKAHKDAVREGKIKTISNNLAHRYKQYGFQWFSAWMEQPALRIFEQLSYEQEIAQIIKYERVLDFDTMKEIAEQYFPLMQGRNQYAKIIASIAKDIEEMVFDEEQGSFIYRGELPRRVAQIKVFPPDTRKVASNLARIVFYFDRPISEQSIGVIEEKVKLPRWKGLKQGEHGDSILEQVDASTGYYGHRPIFAWNDKSTELTAYLMRYTDPQDSSTVMYRPLPLQLEFAKEIGKTIVYDKRKE